MKEIYIRGVRIEYSRSNVKIVDSYAVGKYEMLFILNEFKEESGYASKRDIYSWYREWRVHNWLYDRGLFKGHTKDCDLEENETWWRRVVYFIIGGLV